MPIGGPAFSSVRKAREALKARANEILDRYIRGLDMALANGDYETFQKGYQYLLDHMPAEDGERLVEVSIDKTATEKQLGSGGPQVQIGVIIGGVEAARQLTDGTHPDVQVINVESVKEDTTSKG